jgi:hypothetical protein
VSIKEASEHGVKSACNVAAPTFAPRPLPGESAPARRAVQTGFDGQPKPFVTTGADCWQGTAVQSGSSGVEPADWNVMLLDSTTTTTCIRAHIPLKLNTTLGGAYGRFVQKQRLLDKDAFWVFATP